MLHIFTGLVGGGKTLSAVEWILEHISKGGSCVTNIQLDIKECKRYVQIQYGWKLQEGQIIYIPVEVFIDISKPLHQHFHCGTREMPVLVVLDECSEILDAHQRLAKGQGDGLKEFMSFCRQHRKHNIDMILITQSPSYVVKRVRELAAFWWKFMDMGTMRMPGLQIPMPYPISKFVRQVQFDSSGKLKVKGKWMLKDPSMFKCYKTEETYQEFRLQDRQSTFSKAEGLTMSRAWKMLVWVLCAGLVVLAYRDYRGAGYELSTVQAAIAMEPAQQPVVTMQGLPVYYQKVKGVWRSRGRARGLYLDKWYIVGEMYSFGKIVACTGAGMLVVRNGGERLWILDSGDGEVNTLPWQTIEPEEDE